MPTPTPAFTSTAPTDAAQDELYTYTIGATDPTGGTLTYSIVLSPPGTTITGDILRWTPDHSHSRIENLFQVRATSSNGPTNVQSFTLTPKGTVVVTMVDRFIAEGGTADSATRTIYEARALVPDGNGGFTSILGTTLPDGSRIVEGVPAGHYWLDTHYADPTSPWFTGRSGGPWIWTSASDIDIGQLTKGRHDMVVARGGVIETFDGTNFSEPGHYIVYAPAAALQLEIATDPLTFRTRKFGGLIQASKGDKVWLVHYSDWPTARIERVLESATVEEVDGDGAYVPGALSSVSANATAHPVIAVSEFNHLWPSTVSSAGRIFAIEDVPYDGPPVQRSIPLWTTEEPGEVPPAQPPSPYVIDQTNFGIPLFSTDVENTTQADLGEIAFSNPFAGHTSYAYFRDFRWTRITSEPGMIVGRMHGCTWSSRSLPTATQPIAPAIGPVSSPLVEGMDLMSDQSGVSVTPTISWTAPAVGTPSFYLVRISTSPLVEVERTHGIFLLTDQTQMQIPTGELDPGTAYVVHILSVFNPGIDFQHAPLETVDEHHSCSIVTGTFTTQGTPPVSH